MNAGNRIAIVAVGAVLAILGFVALRPSDDATVTGTQTTTSAAPTTASATPTAQPTTTAPSTTTADTGPRTIVVPTTGGKPVDGVREITATKGERLELRFTSDVDEEIHVHGYDVEKPVGPGKPAIITLTANLEGIFEIELHGSATQIASLRVNPS